MEWESKVPRNSKSVVLVKSEARERENVDAQPNWDFKHTKETVSGITNVYPRRPSLLPASNKNKTPLGLLKQQRVATVSLFHPCVIPNIFNEPSLYPLVAPEIETINVVPYEPENKRIQKIQYYTLVARDEESQLWKEWHEEVTIFDN